ncbi:hypothetical protein [Flavobacterium panici]|uniref:Uncharacterized protein n=1 Tax=Flavobacterium panici TaxID=2654843 RepID=A0A9N8J1A6_9FLAO|nr:hypothetical protein [Flavobacterium panici]CAC9974405.1 hypothetical protein FLAPXU55_02102 [Flavobacterium panici]
MSEKNVAAKVFDTIMSIPGMNEMVRVDLKISRKNVLLLSHLIEKGLLLENDKSSLLGNITADGLEELKNLSQECLQKAGLVELNDKLLSFSQSR